MSPNWFIGYPVDAGTWYETFVLDVPDEMRVFPAPDLHMTLAFLGGVDEEAGREAFSVVVDDPPSPTTITPGPVEPFGNPRRPSAYALTVDRGREELVEVFLRSTDRIRAAADLGPSRYEPRPHITVARPRRRATPEERAVARKWADGKAPPDVTLELDRLALFTWSEDRQERLFREVDELDLT